MDMIRKVYGFLHKEGLHSNAVSEGLHQAMRQRRDRWVKDVLHANGANNRSTRDIIDDDVEVEMPPWASYIHYGG